jgi:hypothetical protein
MGQREDAIRTTAKAIEYSKVMGLGSYKACKALFPSIMPHLWIRSDFFSRASDQRSHLIHKWDMIPHYWIRSDVFALPHDCTLSSCDLRRISPVIVREKCPRFA